MSTKLGEIKHWTNLLYAQLDKALSELYSPSDEEWRNPGELQSKCDRLIEVEILSELGLGEAFAEVQQAKEAAEICNQAARAANDRARKLEGDLEDALTAALERSSKKTGRGYRNNISGQLLPLVMTRRREWRLRNGYEHWQKLLDLRESLNLDISMALATGDIKEFATQFLAMLKPEKKEGKA